MTESTASVDFDTLLDVQVRCPPWFAMEVFQGLMRMHLLRLRFAPSVEDLPHLMGLWSDDLWFAIEATGKAERCDAEIVQKVMRTLRVNSDRWPTPHDFLSLLDLLPVKPMIH